MNPRVLLDTHIVVWFLTNHRKLSREQNRALDDAIGYGECLGFSAISFVEIALLAERQWIIAMLHQIFHELDTNPAFRIFPVTTDIAREVAAQGDSLRDPSDRVIVATARVHRLTLLTADQRIIESDLVAVIE